MKRYIILAVFALGFIMNVNAQTRTSKSTSDAFFTPAYNELRSGTGSGDDPWGTMPRMIGHSLETNQDASPVPIGSGLLLLAGLGLAYGIKRKLKDEN